MVPAEICCIKSFITFISSVASSESSNRSVNSIANIIIATSSTDEYFAGRRQVFDLPLLPVGTEFQLSVWRELLNIPYGGICTYTVQAERLAMPRAVRAVATANGQNALSIFIPCHRVIGRNGRLTGYAGGLETKHFLLEREAAYAPQVRALNTGAAF